MENSKKTLPEREVPQPATEVKVCPNFDLESGPGPVTTLDQMDRERHRRWTQAKIIRRERF